MRRSADKKNIEAVAREAFSGTGCVSSAAAMEPFSDDDHEFDDEDDLSFGSGVDGGKPYIYEEKIDRHTNHTLEKSVSPTHITSFPEHCLQE